MQAAGYMHPFEEIELKFIEAYKKESQIKFCCYDTENDILNKITYQKALKNMILSEQNEQLLCQAFDIPYLIELPTLQRQNCSLKKRDDEFYEKSPRKQAGIKININTNP